MDKGRGETTGATADLPRVASGMEALVRQGRERRVSRALDDTQAAAEEVRKAWSGSCLGYHANVYHAELGCPPPGAHFSPEWGLQETFSDGTVGDWREFRAEDVESAIADAAGNPDPISLHALRDEVPREFDAARMEILSVLEARKGDGFVGLLCDRLAKMAINSRTRVLQTMLPSGQVTAPPKGASEVHWDRSVRSLGLRRSHTAVAVCACMLLSICAEANTRMHSEFSAASAPASRAPTTAPRVAPQHARNAVLAITLSERVETRARRDVSRSGPTEIGVGRQMPDAYRGDLTPLLTWEAQGDGSYVAVLEVSSPGANGMRAGIRALASDGVVFRFFDPHDPTRALPAYRPKSRASRLSEVEVFWSPTVSGDRLGIEIQAPNWGAVADIQFEIDRLSHFVTNPQATRSASSARSSIGNSCSSVPAACGRSSSCSVAATAKLSFVRPDGHAYVCTGTVINDDRDLSEKQNSALLHTAYHCIDSQGTAGSVETEFHYQYEHCEGDRLDSRYGRHFGGADLLEAMPEHDQALIRLRDPLTIGGVCFSGWSANKPEASTGVLGVHHPGGRPKEAVSGQIRDYQAVSFKDLGVVQGAVVEYSEGYTEGGSSGSGFFFGQRDRNSLSPRLVGRRPGG